MKKKFLAAFLGTMMMTSAICSATVSHNQIEIGGIKYGATINDVEKIFGRPDKVSTKTKHYGEKIKYHYGDLEIKFINGKVSEIEMEEHGNLKTAAGIGIGSTIADVERAYGRADSVHKDKYVYFTDDKALRLVFEFKNGVVHEIKCGDID